MTLTITGSDLDTLSRLYRDAEELAAKLRLELADLSIRRAILESQIAKLDAVASSLKATSDAMLAAKPDALRVLPEPGCDPGLAAGFWRRCSSCGEYELDRWPAGDAAHPARCCACDPGLLRGKA